MRRMILGCLGILTAVGLSSATPAVAEKEECASYGTAVDFFDTPREASDFAKKKGLLVMVLHVSGHFEKPEFT